MNCKNNHLSGVPEYVIRLKVNLRIKEHKLFRNNIFWSKYCHRLLLSPCIASVVPRRLATSPCFFLFLFATKSRKRARSTKNPRSQFVSPEVDF